jgi:hypothetical protein
MDRQINISIDNVCERERDMIDRKVTEKKGNKL